MLFHELTHSQDTGAHALLSLLPEVDKRLESTGIALFHFYKDMVDREQYSLKEYYILVADIL